MADLLEAARTVLRRLRDAGFESYFAGGCVRDRLLGVPATEIDIATAAPPDRIEAIFPKTIAVGRAFVHSFPTRRSSDLDRKSVV